MVATFGISLVLAFVMGVAIQRGALGRGGGGGAPKKAKKAKKNG